MKIKSKVMAVLLLSFLFGVQLVKAQDDNMFNHLSAGVSTGTDGLVGLHVAMPIGHHVQVQRAVCHVVDECRIMKDKCCVVLCQGRVVTAQSCRMSTDGQTQEIIDGLALLRLGQKHR